MSPFRRTPQPWDGRDENGRYENKGGYKYDVVSKSIVDRFEDMPKCFLADTREEAEKIYEDFEYTLNNFAYSYSISTGVDKADLFREALIGLARANRDWDPNRSSDFRNYAIYRIKDALNECVRDNCAAVSIPAYIKKANANLKELKDICESYSNSWQTLVYEQEVPIEMEVSDAVRCSKLVSNIAAAADRAKVEYDKFIDRIEMLPEETEYSDEHKQGHYDANRAQEIFEAAIVVEKLKQHMTEEEIKICDGIMLDKSYDQIGKEMGKSKAWVSDKLKAMKDRILSMMGDGSL